MCIRDSRLQDLEWLFPLIRSSCVSAGFNYKDSDAVEVKIDSSNYDFYTDGDTSWAKEDKKVIYAMKKGLQLETTGISSKGTKVIDIYTLKGFTSAVNKLTKDC